jgi:hypothetical protein
MTPKCALAGAPAVGSFLPVAGVINVACAPAFAGTCGVACIPAFADISTVVTIDAGPGVFQSWTCSRIHDCTILLSFLDIILRVLRLKVSVYNVYITNQFQPTFAQVGGGRGSKIY